MEFASSPTASERSGRATKLMYSSDPAPSVDSVLSSIVRPARRPAACSHQHARPLALSNDGMTHVPPQDSHIRGEACAIEPSPHCPLARQRPKPCRAALPVTSGRSLSQAQSPVVTLSPVRYNPSPVSTAIKTVNQSLNSSRSIPAHPSVLSHLWHRGYRWCSCLG